jgi:nucleotide-binding universal stress UspA family protein
MVPALGEKVIAVHNLDMEATRLASRLGVSLAPPLAAMLGTRVQDWLEESACQSEFLITQHPESAAGVIGAARDQAADLIAVGVRGKGTERKGTAELLLDKCHRSLLFIPLGR